MTKDSFLRKTFNFFKSLFSSLSIMFLIIICTTISIIIVSKFPLLGILIPIGIYFLSGPGTKKNSEYDYKIKIDFEEKQEKKIENNINSNYIFNFLKKKGGLNLGEDYLIDIPNSNTHLEGEEFKKSMPLQIEFKISDISKDKQSLTMECSLIKDKNFPNNNLVNSFFKHYGDCYTLKSKTTFVTEKSFGLKEVKSTKLIFTFNGLGKKLDQPTLDGIANNFQSLHSNHNTDNQNLTKLHQEHLNRKNACMRPYNRPHARNLNYIS